MDSKAMCLSRCLSYWSRAYCYTCFLYMYWASQSCQLASSLAHIFPCLTAPEGENLISPHQTWGFTWPFCVLPHYHTQLFSSLTIFSSAHWPFSSLLWLPYVFVHSGVFLTHHSKLKVIEKRSKPRWISKCQNSAAVGICFFCVPMVFSLFLCPISPFCL